MENQEGFSGVPLLYPHLRPSYFVFMGIFKTNESNYFVFMGILKTNELIYKVNRTPFVHLKTWRNP